MGLVSKIARSLAPFFGGIVTILVVGGITENFAIGALAGVIVFFAVLLPLIPVNTSPGDAENAEKILRQGDEVHRRMVERRMKDEEKAREIKWNDEMHRYR